MFPCLIHNCLNITMKLKPQSPQMIIWLLGCVFLGSIKHGLPRSQMLWASPRYQTHCG